MERRKILHLTLKKEWFDMILSGEKKTEYREVKPYWESRLFDIYRMPIIYEVIRFRNGYSRDAPTMDVEWKGVKYSQGDPKIGAIEGEYYYCIQLGSILNYENVKHQTS